MYVVTIDQQHSRRSPDRVPELLHMLQVVPTTLSFERTVGDEVQGLIGSADAVAEAVLIAVRATEWSIGIGLGAVDKPLPESSRAAVGSAFIAAREAVESAKRRGSRLPLALVSSTSKLSPVASNKAVAAAAEAEAVLVLLGQLIAARSATQWRVLDQMQRTPLAPLTKIADALSTSHQAVSATLLRANRQEELAARPAAATLLDRALEVALGLNVLDTL
ncbi:hypothetical protein [Renibacterium salmoninarum]